jgi:hypothetical protein
MLVGESSYKIEALQSMSHTQGSLQGEKLKRISASLGNSMVPLQSYDRTLDAD